MKRKPLVLMILDGWGYREPAPDNAIHHGATPNWDRLVSDCPHSLLQTSGMAVGLPEGQMGNSEVGHMNIGAGRIVYQDYTRINKAIETGEFERNTALCEAIDQAQAAGGAVHIMGLLSPGGVHSHEDQFFASLRMAADRGAERLFVHAFLDGRDTPPRSAASSIRALEGLIAEIPGAFFASVTGRYFAMDRDERWDRVAQAWDAIVKAEASHGANAATKALEEAYARGENDEFVQPTVLDGYAGIEDGDSVIFINFRADRARELTRAFVEPNFGGFACEPPVLTAFTCMTEYLSGLPVSIAFPPETLSGLLGEVLASEGLTQLRTAETEKYAHVTFFMNGGQEAPFAGETRELIPSPRVATYDLQPEMNAPKLSIKLDQAIRSGQYDVIICNVANPDMVGHTGIMEAALKAVAAVDDCLGIVHEAIQCTGGELLVTADHGNVEQMTDSMTGQPHTAHTTNPVPLVFCGRPGFQLRDGSLRDIAPTMLFLLDLRKPDAMTGTSLLEPSVDNNKTT